MSSEAPINAGHAFANAAEDYEEKELWKEAAEAHSNAAARFEVAISDALDKEAIKTLKLLSANHTRKAQELDRKFQRIQASERQQQLVDSKNRGGLLNALPDKQRASPTASLVSRLANKNMSYFSEGSQQLGDGIGGSFALLSNDGTEVENSDPFNKFLEVVETLVQQLSNPAVAFASAPLNENDYPLSLPTQETPEEDEVEEENSDPNQMMESYYFVPEPKGFYNSVQKTNEQRNQLNLNVENEKLRQQIAQLTKKIKILERTAEESNMLKSSILQFRNDVHKQAKRIMQSQHESSMRSSAVALGSSHVPVHSSLRYPIVSGGNDLVTRLKDLEEENQQLKLQNEKQKVVMNKYRDRWESLKENAKKRRSTTKEDSETQF
ncbi:hypothetical protein K501DRAFT_29407 [Backusella circina FSU 941]|nr:hypothetical protein K501DRAFT_29407 [Backusella circina FSU 941]